MGQILCQQKPKYLLSIQDPEQLQTWLQEHPDLIGVSMVGRSNVGKSSLINAIFGLGTARISKTPGRTKEIIVFQFHLPQAQNEPPFPPLYLFDLPGYGHAEVSKAMSKNWNELLAIFFTHIPPEVILLNIQDGRHPNLKVDKEFQLFIRQYPLESLLVFNKIDKLKTQKERSVLEKMKKQMIKEFKKFRQIYFVSAEKGNGIDELKLGLTNYFHLKIETQKLKVDLHADDRPEDLS